MCAIAGTATNVTVDSVAGAAESITRWGVGTGDSTTGWCAGATKKSIGKCSPEPARAGLCSCVDKRFYGKMEMNRGSILQTIFLENF